METALFIVAGILAFAFAGAVYGVVDLLFGKSDLED